MKVELECAKETLELCQGLAKFAAAVKQALADGWQPGTDLPALITATVADLVPALQGVDQLPAEVAASPEFVNALYAGLSPIVFQFLPKKA